MLHWPRFQGKGYHTIYHTNFCVIKPFLALPNSPAKKPITQTITHALPATIFAFAKKNKKHDFLLCLSWNTTFSNGFAWRVLKPHETVWFYHDFRAIGTLLRWRSTAVQNYDQSFHPMLTDIFIARATLLIAFAWHPYHHITNCPKPCQRIGLNSCGLGFICCVIFF